MSSLTSILGFVSLLCILSLSSFIHPEHVFVRAVKKKNSIHRHRNLEELPNNHTGNCHGDPVCDECSCVENGNKYEVKCDNPDADLAVYKCNEMNEVEPIGCHCDGYVLHCWDNDHHDDHDEDCHCDGDKPHCEDSADEDDYVCPDGHDDDHHDDHDEDCHCDGDKPHCEDSADEDDYVCPDGHDDDHHDEDDEHDDDHKGDCHCDDGVAHCNEEADEKEYQKNCKNYDIDEDLDPNKFYCLAGDMYGMPEQCMIDTTFRYKDDTDKDCMNWLRGKKKDKFKKLCSKTEIKKKCAGVCNTLRCKNTIGNEYCRDTTGKINVKMPKDENGKRKKKKLTCKQILEKDLCEHKNKKKSQKLRKMCPVSCDECLMLPIPPEIEV